MTDRYYYSCVIVSVMSICVPSDEKKNEIMWAFHKLVENSTDQTLKIFIPEQYAEMERYVFNNCLLTSMMKKVPLCLKCRQLVPTDHYFCPHCQSTNVPSPLYRYCKTKKCHQECEIKDLLRKCARNDKEAIKKAKELSCSHSAKVPWATCVYYVPILAVVLELLRSRMFNELPFTSNSEMLTAVKEALLGNAHALTSLNAVEIFERWGMGIIAGGLRAVQSRDKPIDVSAFCAALEQEIVKNKALLNYKDSIHVQGRTPAGVNPPEDLPSLQFMTYEEYRLLGSGAICALSIDSYLSRLKKVKEQSGRKQQGNSTGFRKKRSCVSPVCSFPLFE